MLTKIEIDGFKTFKNFRAELSPMTVILGHNATGKSNLFDAIRLLSQMASVDLLSAAKSLRGEPYELFGRKHDASIVECITIAVEVLIEPEVKDPWGQVVIINHSRIRYEVRIERKIGANGIERLEVVKESAEPIFWSNDKWRPWGRSISKEFRRKYLRYGRRTPWLSTKEINDKKIFSIGQDLRKGRTRSADVAEATVLSSITSAEFPHLYALREEMRSWRFLQLDPASLRRPSPKTAKEALEPDGSNLAAVLARIKAETKTKEQIAGALADISADLTYLIPGVVDLQVEEDYRTREYRVDIGMRGSPLFSSRVISDGTLRVLALLTLLHDPKHKGLVCFEEPENGVHPARLKAMILRLRELVSNPGSHEQENAHLSQIIMNSHSPVVLSCLGEGEAFFMDLVSSINANTKGIDRYSRIRRVRVEPQGELESKENSAFISSFEVDKYLATASRTN